MLYYFIRYLDAYEKVYFHGADPNHRDDEEETEGPLRKKACLPLYGIPLSYNYDQHRVSGGYSDYLFTVIHSYPYTLTVMTCTVSDGSQ